MIWTAPEKTGWRCGACGHYVCAEEGHYCAPMRGVDLHERGVLALERIAAALEVRSTVATGYPPLRKVTPEEWERLSPLARQGAYVG